METAENASETLKIARNRSKSLEIARNRSNLASADVTLQLRLGFWPVKSGQCSNVLPIVSVVGPNYQFQLLPTLSSMFSESLSRGRHRCRRRGHRDHGGQLQPTFRAEYGGLLRCRRCSRCLPASGQAGHRLGGCQVAWGARELRRRRPSQTPQWTPGRVPSAALPEAAAAFPSGLIVHVVVLCAGMNVSVVRSAGGGRWSNPPSPPGASRVRKGGPTSNI